MSFQIISIYYANMDTILIVDDETAMCVSLAKLFKAHNYNAIYTSDSCEVENILKENNILLVITDYKMPGITGTSLIKSIKQRYPDLPVIMISGYGSVDTIVTAMRYGALNYYEKPLKFQKLLSEVNQLSEVKTKKSEKKIDETIITNNEKMLKALQIVNKIASTDIPVIITGESGTGKELIARKIQLKSSRAEKPYIKINCASIPETLIESELFGHERGAFTDAKDSRKGKFEIAEGGTIFFDEIGELNINTQAKLLRVLQEKEFERLGSNKVKPMDVRFITATNKDLKTLIQEGTFRDDLYYRLSVVHLELPTLKERQEDIIPLANQFLKLFNQKYSKSVTSISNDTISIFINHSWPGNIRELKNCMERSVIFCESDIILPEHLPSQYNKDISPEDSDMKGIYDNVTREVILNALNTAAGNKSKAAEILSINRRTLYNKMKRLGMG
ncbi:MAG: sigma-54-dependent Fis family transcriptional regulator [Spirochaetes bacterium]|nr:MAG: sigma-54-dependent Fis family transcriptional regulator [Spirochaetota bacterium]